MGKECWYQEGVRFSCTQCGRCCTGPEGFVWVDDHEVKAIAKYLNLSIEELHQKHTHLVDMDSLDSVKNPSLSQHTDFFPPTADGEENAKKASLKKKQKRSLIETPSEKNPGDFDCTFLAENGSCSIYPHRPKQCRTYPYWPEILKSKRSWENEARYCEGINHPEAEVVAFPSIQKNLTEQIEYERSHKPQ